METTATTEVTDSTDVDLDGVSLTGRLKSGISLVQTRITSVPNAARAQWNELPEHLGELTDRLAARVRKTLDLPAKSELDELLVRIQEIDEALASLIPSEPPKPKAKTKTKWAGAATKAKRKKA